LSDSEHLLGTSIEISNTEDLLIESTEQLNQMSDFNIIIKMRNTFGSNCYRDLKKCICEKREGLGSWIQKKTQ